MAVGASLESLLEGDVQESRTTSLVIRLVNSLELCSKKAVTFFYFLTIIPCQGSLFLGYVTFQKVLVQLRPVLGRVYSYLFSSSGFTRIQQGPS